MLNAYVEMLPELQAERQLLAIEAASVPEMDQRARMLVISRYERRIGGSVVRAKSAVDALTQAGIPIKHVPKSTGRAGTIRKGERG